MQRLWLEDAADAPSPNIDHLGRLPSKPDSVQPARQLTAILIISWVSGVAAVAVVVAVVVSAAVVSVAVEGLIVTVLVDVGFGQHGQILTKFEL